MDQKIKIKCIGFSVTGYGNNAYPVKIREYFKKNDPMYEISAFAVGGLSIDSLSYLIKIAIEDDIPNIVVLEITTSWYSLINKDQKIAEGYIRKTINLLEHYNVEIIFLHLYRRDLDDEDIVTKAIEYVNQKKYPEINLKTEFRREFLKSGYDGTLDGIHPNEETTNYISNKVSEYIKNYPINKKSELPNNINLSSYSLINLPERGSDYFYNNEKYNLKLRCTSLELGETLHLEMDHEISVNGLFFLYGPETNFLNINIGGQNLKIITKDSHSYYKRIGYRKFGAVFTTSRITLNHPNELINVKLEREPYQKIETVNNFIIGFSLD